jgi:hypothetical protein
MRIGRCGSVFDGGATGVPDAVSPDTPPLVVVQAARMDDAAASENARRERRGDDEFKLCSGGAAGPGRPSVRALQAGVSGDREKRAHHKTKGARTGTKRAASIISSHFERESSASAHRHSSSKQQ